jgi:hypothetical protein
MIQLTDLNTIGFRTVVPAIVAILASFIVASAAQTGTVDDVFISGEHEPSGCPQLVEQRRAFANGGYLSDDGRDRRQSV